MRIAVLVKHVPCAPGGLGFAADHTLSRSGRRAQLNEADAGAVELAWRIALRHHDAQITAVTMGPAPAAVALHRALVLGADEGIHVLDEALPGSDALATSRVLEVAVRRIGFDLVLCGAASSDSGMAVVPAMLAERLEVPALCFADAVRVADGRVEIRRHDGHGAQILAAELPAVVSVTQRCAVPRYPRFSAIMQARHKLIRTWSLSRLGIDRAEAGLAAAAATVQAVRPAAGKKRVKIECEAPAAAAQLADFLAERDFL